MKKLVVVASTLLITTSCAKNVGQNSTARPKLVMVAGQTSLGANFYAQLLGDIGKQYRFYCLEQLWEFGDGASRLYTYNCADWEPKDPWLPKRVFRQYYSYPRSGEYEAKLTLRKNGVPVAIAKYTILVSSPHKQLE